MKYITDLHCGGSNGNKNGGGNLGYNPITGEPITQGVVGENSFKTQHSAIRIYSNGKGGNGKPSPKSFVGVEWKTEKICEKCGVKLTGNKK